MAPQSSPRGGNDPAAALKNVADRLSSAHKAFCAAKHVLAVSLDDSGPLCDKDSRELAALEEYQSERRGLRAAVRDAYVTAGSAGLRKHLQGHGAASTHAKIEKDAFKRVFESVEDELIELGIKQLSSKSGS
jgi:hypothetical protein